MTRARLAIPGWRTRGFALIDIVVALGIVLVLGALAIPTFVGMLARTRLEEGAGRIESVAAICRAEAIRRGAIVELAFRTTPTGEILLLGRRRDAIPTSEDAAAMRGSDTDSLGDDAAWPAFLVEPLPGGITFLAPAQGAMIPEGEPANAADEPPPTGSGVLVIFLPSGGARSPGEGWHVRVGRGGDAAERMIRVNAWTGAIRLEAVSPADDAGPREETGEAAPETQAPMNDTGASGEIP